MNKPLARELRQHIKDCKLSIRKTAELIGCSSSYLSHYLNDDVATFSTASIWSLERKIDAFLKRDHLEVLRLFRALAFEVENKRDELTTRILPEAYKMFRRYMAEQLKSTAAKGR